MVESGGRPATVADGGRTVGCRSTTDWQMQPMPRSSPDWGVPLPTLAPSPGVGTMRSPCSYKVAGREYGSLVTATAPQALGLVFSVNVGAGTLVIADEAMSKDC